jgi:UDP-N-acetylmuramoyl-tripeptide--D-alanyl-D-alanine ligase
VLGPLAVESVDPIEIRDEHDRIGRIVVRLNIKKLVVVGNDARHLFKAAELEGSWNGESVLCQSVTEAYDLLRAEIREGDTVLVKVPGLTARLSEAAA